jgi:Flp pilus assembly pilin Flp
MGQEIEATVSREYGQGLTEYAVILALILVIVMGTVRLVGGKARNVFSDVANTLQRHTDHD